MLWSGISDYLATNGTLKNVTVAIALIRYNRVPPILVWAGILANVNSSTAECLRALTMEAEYIGLNSVSATF